jgi:hypothetical protein
LALPAPASTAPADEGRAATNKTRGGALTVAGQWRIFTAFPNIPLRLQIEKLRLKGGDPRPKSPARYAVPEAFFIED